MRKFKIISAIFILVITIGGGTLFFLGKDAEGAEGKTEVPAEEIVARSIDTDVITTNLASPGNYAIVQFNILLSSEKSKEEAEKRTAEIRAAVISTIASFTKDQLVGVEGIVELEQQLAAKLKTIMQAGQVERVLVTEFKVQ